MKKNYQELMTLTQIVVRSPFRFG